MLEALGLEEVWLLLQKSKEEYQLFDKSPETHKFSFGYETPSQVTKEAISHEVFQFCVKYLERYHNTYRIPRHRVNIRPQLTELYGEQIFQNLLGKSTISCYTANDPTNGNLKISFYSDRILFKPYRWEFYSKDGELTALEEDETRSGRKESFTTFSPNQCIKEVKKDKNGIGSIDEWWIYENCQLVRVEYDENENGFRERICIYESGKLSTCQGIGEKEEKEAKVALAEGNTDLALKLFNKALDEIKKEFQKPSFKSCSLLSEIISLDYQKKNFNSFAKNLDEFLSISICEKSSLNILIYKAYYQLYLSQNYKEAKKTYRKAAEEYFKTNGEENPELILNLSLAEYMDKDPLSCISSLERLRERRMLHVARFYFFYYRASCNLLLSKHLEAVEDLKKALAKSQDSEYHPLIHFKIAHAYYSLNRTEDGHPYLLQALNKDLTLIQQILDNPLYSKFTESSQGKSLISKYSLQVKQK
ncbi:MAG: tetratricopeptide repeat protein [Leptospira sp.]|nr:tetratricopeptide repeat protein [Leptospira sp.]